MGIDPMMEVAKGFLPRAQTKTEREQTKGIKNQAVTSQAVQEGTATMVAEMTPTGKTTTTGTVESRWTPADQEMWDLLHPWVVRTRPRSLRSVKRQMLWGRHPLLLHLLHPFWTLATRKMYHLPTLPSLLVLAFYLLLAVASGFGFCWLLFL